jgi:predicted transcriptional regulator
MSTLLSVRLEDMLNEQINSTANKQHKTRTEIVKEALELYFSNSQAKLKKQMKILHQIDDDNDYFGDNLW